MNQAFGPVVIQPSSSATLQADCPSGKVAVGGGYEVDLSLAGSIVRLTGSKSVGQSWTIQLTNFGSSSAETIPAGVVQAACLIAGE